MDNRLSPAQSAALFDILSHHNTYAEIRDFRHPGSLKYYGPPFVVEKGKSSTSPSLQGLVSKFVLNLPGLKDVPEDIWKVQLLEIIEGLEQANLSESYDKGVVGSRKTVATAISALIEYPVRGTSGGFTKVADPVHEYDLSKADDLARAFRNFMDEAIYGTALDDLVEKTTQTDKLAEHEPLTQAVHEFILVNVASFMHYTIILSPKGQYLLKLLGNANKLVPYLAIRQTLKIGNVASMISAMMRVILAKLSVASLTNWIGITQSEDTGLNLMQQIISSVLHWEISDLEKRASKIESDKESPSKAQIACLKEYLNLSLEAQDVIRHQSQQASISIVLSILANSELPTDLSEPTHKLALEYLSVVLSVRDRKEIIRLLCHNNPDHVTTTVRTMVNAYEPVIRHIHNAVDLSDTVSDFQAFLSDMIKMSKIPPPGKDGETIIPTVGDFVQLLKKHQYSCHKFLHQCCKNGKELTGWYRDWLKAAASQFRRDTISSDATIRDAGHLNDPLNDLFSKLPQEKQATLIPLLDAQSKYLDHLHASSKERLEAVLKSLPSKNPTISKILASKSNASSRAPSPDHSGRVTPLVAATLSSTAAPASDPGPGAYLARWQDLLDSTPITPKSASGEEATGPEGNAAAKKVGAGKEGKPDVRPVIEAMGQDFRTLLANRGLYW